MGFGILFLGYLLTFGSAFFSMYLFGDIVGCAVMIGAFVMLSQYCKMFRYAAVSAGALCSLYVTAAVMRMMGYSTPEGESIFLIGERLYVLLQYAISVATMVFCFVLLIAIAKQAVDVGLPDIAKRSRVYMTVYGVYFSVWLFFSVFSERLAASSVIVYNVTGNGLALFSGIWIIMMSVQILSCLKWIAPEEQVEAEERGDDSKDNVLTRVGDRLNKIQEKARTPREVKERMKDLGYLGEKNESENKADEESDPSDKQ